MEKSQQKYDTFVKSYWNYYLDLDKQMMETRKYVDFDEVNFNTYSIEFLKLYQAVCSEIDVVGKKLANEVNSNFKSEDESNNILKWWYEIQDWYSDWKKKTVSFRQQYNLTPWEYFKVEYLANINGRMYYRVSQVNNFKMPTWWTAYNKVKHNRTSIDKKTNAQNYIKANLLNLSNAYAALYLLEKNYIDYFGDAFASQTTGISALFESEQPIFTVKDDGCLHSTHDYD